MMNLIGQPSGLTENQKEFFWRYGVRVYGIKKRCRKEEFHFSDKDELGKDSAVNWEKAQKLARLWLIKNMKSFRSDKAIVTATKWRVENDMETWAMFSDTDNLSQKLEVEH